MVPGRPAMLRCPRRWLSPALVALAAAPGCYGVAGVRSDRDVAGDLTAGMGREEALTRLGTGGSIAVKREYARSPSGDWDLEEDDGHRSAILESLRRSEESGGREVRIILQVSRTWGFMGFGIFHLFLDRDGHLIGHHLRHIN